MSRGEEVHSDRTPKDSHVLVVDDEQANILMLERLLEWAGYNRVTSVTNPTLVAEICRLNPPDIILLDLQMPEMDGYQVLAEVRANQAPEDFLPVLVFTADINPDSRKKALAMGANDFLTKPGDATEIMLRVHNFLQTRTLHRQMQNQNLVLEERVKERTSELVTARFEVLQRLAKAGEFRDDDTGEHTRRVGEFSSELAIRINDPDVPADILKLAAPLHDIGKIGIPDAILLKRGKLTDEEFEVMKTHTTIGAEILKDGSNTVVKMAETVALTHHEKWNGAGYPLGLKGEMIPLCSRIVAVADVFDALTHVRPYKEAWPVEKAVEEIRNLAGIHFDPAVVAAFEASVRLMARKAA